MFAKPLTVVALLIMLSMIMAIGRSSAQSVGSQGQPTRHRVQLQPQKPFSGNTMMMPVASLRHLQDNPMHAGTTTILSEDFEGTWPKGPLWDVFDQATQDGPSDYLWGKRTCRAIFGIYGGMTVGGGKRGQNRSCSSNYPNNMDSWAIYGPIDLSQASDAVLTFYLKGKTEGTIDQPIDYLFVGASTDNVNFAPEINNIGGDLLTNGPYVATIPLGATGQVNMLGQSQVWISFIFSSDSSVANIGLTIDNITLDVQYNDTPTVTSTATSTATPTTPTATPTVTPTATPTVTPGSHPEPRIFIAMLAAAPPLCPVVTGQNSPSKATLLAGTGQSCIGSAMTSSDGEYHWYAVDLNAGQTLTVDLVGLPAGADYDIYLYDKRVLQTLDLNHPLASGTNNQNADENFSFTSATAARYYLLVYLRTKSTTAPNTYVLNAARS